MKRLCTPYTACTRRNIARERMTTDEMHEEEEEKNGESILHRKMPHSNNSIVCCPGSLSLYLSREKHTENRPTKLTVWICFSSIEASQNAFRPWYCVYCEMFIVRNGILTRFRRIEPTVRHRAQLLLYFTDEQKWKRERKMSKNWTFFSRATQMSGWLTPFICLNSSVMYNVCTE